MILTRLSVAAIHRPGKMVADLAIVFAAGGEQVIDIDQLRSSPGLFTPVDSDATISWLMSQIKDEPPRSSTHTRLCTAPRRALPGLGRSQGEESCLFRATVSD